MNISELKNKPNLFRLYSILMMLSDGKKVETSYTELSELSGFHRHTIRRNLNELSDLQIIENIDMQKCADHCTIVRIIVRKLHNKEHIINNAITESYNENVEQNSRDVIRNIVRIKEDPPSSLPPTPPITSTTEENIYDNNYLSIYNKDNLSTDAHTREDSPIHKWIAQLKTERYWQELVCMKHKILPADIIKFLDDYGRDILIRGKQMFSISDVKHYFDYWLPNAIKQHRNDSRSNGFVKLLEEKKRLEQQLAEEDERQRRIR